jgi:hypothetical protein
MLPLNRPFKFGGSQYRPIACSFHIPATFESVACLDEALGCPQPTIFARWYEVAVDIFHGFTEQPSRGLLHRWKFSMLSVEFSRAVLAHERPSSLSASFFKINRLRQAQLQRTCLHLHSHLARIALWQTNCVARAQRRCRRNPSNSNALLYKLVLFHTNSVCADGMLEIRFWENVQYDTTAVP